MGFCYRKCRPIFGSGNGFFVRDRYHFRFIVRKAKRDGAAYLKEKR